MSLVSRSSVVPTAPEQGGSGENGGSGGRHKDCALRGVEQPFVVWVGEFADEQRDGEADPGELRHADDVGPP